MTTFADARPFKQVQFFKGAVCKIRMQVQAPQS